MSAVTVEEAMQAVEDLEKMMDASRTALTNDFPDEFMPGSLADSEHSSFSRPELIESATQLGRFYLISAADHLWGFARTLGETPLAVAPISCIRVHIEAASRAVWLLDPNISVQERVARQYALRFADVDQQRKTAESLGDPAGETKAVAQLDKLDKEAVALGYKSMRSGSGRVIGLGRALPQATQMAEDVLGKGTLYRVCSSAVHGNFAALKDLSYATGPTIPGTSSSSIKVGIQAGPVVAFCLDGAISLAKVVWEIGKYLGGSLVEVTLVFENGFNSLGIPESNRPWVLPT